MQKVFGKSKKEKQKKGEVECEEGEQVLEKLASVGLPKQITLADFEKVRTLGMFCAAFIRLLLLLLSYVLAGTGTFGRVFLVKHIASGNFFALKVLRKMEVVRLKQVDHIKNEKQILSAVCHPFIVSL